MDKVVITGATGFLGRNLTSCFLERGAEVTVLVRKESAGRALLPVHDKLRIVETGMEDVLSHLDDIGSADGWFHFAWGGVNRQEIDSPEVQERNIRGSLNCVEAARRLGCQVFMDAGSRVEYGVTNEIMAETLECHPINEYGKAKLKFFEKAAPLCQQYGMNYCHLRFFSVYGFGDHPWSVISTLTRELRKGNTVSLSACLHKWNFMYIDDAVEAVVRLYEREKIREFHKPQAVNIASRDTRVLKEFVEEVRQIAGGGILQYGTFVQAKEGALSICPDVGRMEKMTGGFQEKYTFHQGITETIKKEMEHEYEETQHTDSML